MAYGLQLWRADGTLEVDVSSRLTRMIYKRNLPADETDSVTLADWNSANGFAVAFSTDPASIVDASHAVTWSGTTISWTPMAQVGFRSNSVLMVFLYK